MLKKNLISVVILVLSVVTLYISMRLFWNMGVFVDENNTSPGKVYGGNFWLAMEWLQFLLLAIIAMLAAVNIFSRR